MKTRSLWIASLLLAVALASCADGQRDSDPEGSSQELIIYSGRSESLVQPIIEQFSKETGIDAQVRYGGTAELAVTLLEEGDNSPADVFYAQDPGGLGAIEEAGLFSKLPGSILDVVPPGLASEDEMWVGVSGRARVVVYNTDSVTAEQLPADLWGFTDAKWKGQIGWAPTNASFQAMVTGMRAIWGEERSREWLLAMQSNEPSAFDGNTSLVAAVGAGEVVFGLTNHYYLHRFLSEEGQNFAADNYFLPSGGPGSLIMVSGVGVLKTSANREAALRFLEFLLSEETQEYFSTTTFEYPVISDVGASPSLPALEELTLHAADISPSRLADLEGTARLLTETAIIP